MSNSERNRKPKPQAAAAGVPPRPPKKTARGLEGDSPDDHFKKLSTVERAKIRDYIKDLERKQT